MAAAGCDSTTVGLFGVTSATTGRSVDLGSSAAVTRCLDVATVPSACFARSVSRTAMKLTSRRSPALGQRRSHHGIRIGRGTRRERRGHTHIRIKVRLRQARSIS